MVDRSTPRAFPVIPLIGVMAGLALLCVSVGFLWYAFTIRRDYPGFKDPSPGMDDYWPAVEHSISRLISAGTALAGLSLLAFSAWKFLKLRSVSRLARSEAAHSSSPEPFLCDQAVSEKAPLGRPGGMTNCYVLAPVRSAVLATQFPGEFLANHEPSYQPNVSIELLEESPEADFEMQCTYLALNDSAACTFYWRSTTGLDPLHAAMAFNSDGSLVFGLSVVCPENTPMETTVEPWLKRLQVFASNPPTIFGSGFPPPPTLFGGGLPPPARADFEA